MVLTAGFAKREEMLLRAAAKKARMTASTAMLVARVFVVSSDTGCDSLVVSVIRKERKARLEMGRAFIEVS
jgi:hypothetical protein